LFHVNGGGEGIGGTVIVWQDVDGEGAGEPDQILATGDTCEIAGEFVHGVQGIAHVERGLQTGYLVFEGLEVGDNVAERWG